MRSENVCLSFERCRFGLGLDLWLHVLFAIWMGRSDVACWSFGCARLAGGSPARRTRAPMSALEVSTTLDPPLELTDVTRDSRDETREDRAREAELRCE